MATHRSYRRAMIFNAVRKLFAAGAMSAVIRAAVNQSHRADLTRKTRLSVQAVVRRMAFYAIGGVFFIIAAGFLVAAIYLGLREAFIAPIAALLTGLLLVGAGTCIVLVGSKKIESALEEEAPAAAEETEEKPPTDVMLEFVQDMIKSAGKNVGLLVAALFLIGLWFGFGREKAVAGDGDDDGGESAASQDRHDSRPGDDVEPVSPMREQSFRDEVNSQRTEVF